MQCLCSVQNRRIALFPRLRPDAMVPVRFEQIQFNSVRLNVEAFAVEAQSQSQSQSQPPGNSGSVKKYGIAPHRSRSRRRRRLAGT